MDLLKILHVPMPQRIILFIARDALIVDLCLKYLMDMYFVVIIVLY